MPTSVWAIQHEQVSSTAASEQITEHVAYRVFLHGQLILSVFLGVVWGDHIAEEQHDSDTARERHRISR